MTGLGFCRPSTLVMVTERNVGKNKPWNKEKNGDGMSMKSFDID